MTFNYDSVHGALNAHHPSLCNWLSLGWDKKTATVQYKLKDGTIEDVSIDLEGNVTASKKLMAEMEAEG